MDNLTSPDTNAARVAARPELRLVTVPVAITRLPALQPARTRAIPTQPHPILPTSRSGARSRSRSTGRLLVKAVLGAYGEVPYGPTSALLWIRHGSAEAVRPGPRRPPSACWSRAGGWTGTETACASATASRSCCDCWSPTPAPSATQMSLLIQQQLRQVGVEARAGAGRRSDLDRAADRRAASTSTSPPRCRIPSPSGLVQSWSCNGSQQRRPEYCDPAVDSLLERAVLARDDARSTWHEVLRRIEADAPATFLYAQTYAFVVNRRFRDVAIRPESSWISVWRWKVGARARRGRRGKLVGHWLLRRAAQAAATFVIAVTLLFFLMRLAPGDPLWRVQEGESLTPEARAVLERMYGIDRPLPEQFVTFLQGVARGDLGSSIGYGLPVTTLIARDCPRPCSSAERFSCSTSRWDSGSACVRRCGEGGRRTGRSRCSRSHATRPRRSGWA